jgi:hypothetical protein
MLSAFRTMSAASTEAGWVRSAASTRTVPAAAPTGIGLAAETTVPLVRGLKTKIEALITIVKNTPTETATSSSFFFSMMSPILPAFRKGSINSGEHLVKPAF